MKLSLKVDLNSQVWMSHSDSIKSLPTNGVKLASTNDVEFAAYKIEEPTYAIQYHPEYFILLMDQKC
jgi:GMP synthase (glutamine-hydrolysing)